MDTTKLERVKEIIASVVGISKERGDVVVVHTLEQLVSGGKAVEAPNPLLVREPEFAAKQDSNSQLVRGLSDELLLALALAATFLLTIFLVLSIRAKSVKAASLPTALTTAEREKLLKDVNAWLAITNAVEQGKR